MVWNGPSGTLKLRSGTLRPQLLRRSGTAAHAPTSEPPRRKGNAKLIRGAGAGVQGQGPAVVMARRGGVLAQCSAARAGWRCAKAADSKSRTRGRLRPQAPLPQPPSQPLPALKLYGGAVYTVIKNAWGDAASFV